MKTRKELEQELTIQTATSANNHPNSKAHKEAVKNAAEITNELETRVDEVAMPTMAKQTSLHDCNMMERRQQAKRRKELAEAEVKRIKNKLL